MQRIDRRSGSAAGLGMCLLVLLGTVVVPSVRAQVLFYDPDGRALPFQSFEEVEEFLETAEIVWKDKLEAGTNKRKRKIMLEKNGLKAHAILRTGYEVKDSPGGGFVDSCHSEVAAYQLSRLLGLDSVPPAVRRKGGSIQIWIENATTDASRREKDAEPEDPVAFERQIQVMGVFDNLIANTDRNPGNILIDGAGKIWFIDHTRSFAGQTELKYPDKISGCDRALWSRLRSLSDSELEAAMRPYLRLYLNELLVRRQLVVGAIQTLIDSRGEDAVLFDLD